jgi:hypothetical protein
MKLGPTTVDFVGQPHKRPVEPVFYDVVMIDFYVALWDVCQSNFRVTDQAQPHRTKQVKPRPAHLKQGDSA